MDGQFWELQSGENPNPVVESSVLSRRLPAAKLLLVMASSNGCTETNDPLGERPSPELVNTDPMNNPVTAQPDAQVNTLPETGCDHERQVLYLLNDVEIPEGLDQGLIQRIGAQGFVVTQILEASDPPCAFADYSLIVVSDTSSQTAIPVEALRESTAPILVLENSVYEGLGLAMDGRRVEGSSQIDFVESRHPLAANLSGTVDVFTRPNPAGTAAGLGDAAIVIATLRGDPGRATVFGYEAGTPLGDNSIAPARRAGLFLSLVSLRNLTEESNQLFDAAVQWLVAPPVPVYSSCSGLRQQQPNLPAGVYVLDPQAFTPTFCE